MAKKHPGAVQLGKLGGKARSKKLSKKQRKEIARLGGFARWKKARRRKRSFERRKP
jgi:hypothetical protein